MNEKLAKFGRMLRRDHLTAVAVGVCAATVAVAGGIGLVLGAPLAWAMAGILFSGVLAASFVACEEVKMRRMKDVDLGFRTQDGIGSFQHLTGPARKVAIIMNTEALLPRMMHRYRMVPALPPEALKKLQPYLKDAEEAGREVKAVLPGTPVELPAFELIRKYFNAAGALQEQIVAKIPLLHAPMPWEIERRQHEAEQRQRDMLEAEIAAMHAGAARAVAVRTLRFKPKSGPSQSRC